MRLESIKLQQFRNLNAQTVSFPTRVSLIIGRNGQGKTSLLEAIYLLSQAKSFRESHSQELVNWNEERECLVDANIKTTDGTVEISYKVVKGSRHIFVNGERVKKASSFYGKIKAIEFIPEDLFLIKGGPNVRRRFIDKVLAMIDSAYVENIVHYQRALKNRNVILKKARNNSELVGNLGPWDILLVKHGLEVVKKRRAFIKALEPRLVEHYEAILGDEKKQENVSLSYKSDFNKPETPEELLNIYREYVYKDVQRKNTIFGPHRDDLLIFHHKQLNEKTAKVSASQGQTRSMALAFKLAAADFIVSQTEDAPLILLDDVESELDENRKNALYERLRAYEKSQVIITATEVSEAFKNKLSESQILLIHEGEITTQNSVQN